MSPRSGGTLFIDASAGAAGDMLVAALVDAGAPLAAIRRALRELPLHGWTLRASRVEEQGLAARRFEVRVREDQPARGWREIRRVLAGTCGVAEGARTRALAVFRRLIEAEARVHGTSPERTHLHEAGGVDAIVDVLATAIALDRLAPSRIVVSPMTTGYGSVRCSHGLYPVPAPATAELVRGFPIRAGEVEGERLTPTGAAILTTIADAWGELPPMRPARIGYGAGSRRFPGVANVVRVVLGDPDAPPPSAGERAEVAVIECDVDDATPQALAFAAERLFEAGALDVSTVAVTMKKGRAGHRLTVLCRPPAVGALAGVLFDETPTLGLRYRVESRIELRRSVVAVRTRYGVVRVKEVKDAKEAREGREGRLGGRPTKVAPEHDDCAKLARRHDVGLETVRRAALEAHAARRGMEPEK